MIRRLDSERLENILLAFYRPAELPSRPLNWLGNLFRPKSREPRQEGVPQPGDHERRK